MIYLTYRAAHVDARSRVLVERLAELDPDAQVLVLDLCANDAPAPPGQVLRPDSLGGEGVEHLVMTCRSADELALSLVPFAVHQFVSEGHDVLFVSPNTLLLELPRPLLDLATSVRGAVVVPRMPARPHTDLAHPTAREILARGIIDEGLVAVSRFGGSFTEWWRSRNDPRELARRHGAPEDLPSFSRGYTERHVPWLDAALTRPDVTTAPPGWQRSAWNIDSDEIFATDASGSLHSGGTTVGSIDLSTIDVHRPWLAFGEHTGAPRLRFSEHPELWRTVSPWLQSVLAVEEFDGADSRMAMADGTPVDQRMRRLHERSLVDGDEPPERPFSDVAGAVAYRNWLNAPSAHEKVGRYLRTVWVERDDLRIAFPEGLVSGADQFLDWVRTHGVTEERIPPDLVPPAPVTPTRDVDATATAGRHLDPVRGVLVSGYLNSVMGLGEAARLIIGAVASSGIEHSTYTYTSVSAEQGASFVDHGDHAVEYDTHIACVNIDTFPTFVRDLGPAFFDGRHTIGLWFWETSIIPEYMLSAFDHVDEVWVACEFVRDILARYTSKVISIYPQPVPVPERGTASRTELGLPEDFTFLFAFDFNSVIERKNPLALVRAFTAAFAPGEGPQLVLKTINGSRRPADHERLLLATLHRPDIHVVDGFFPAAKRDAWTAACDCYVSLHRSEGFGLTMAEAMAAGKPVIASRYSGNLQFMNDDNSILIGVEETTVPAGCEPYPAGAVWASPNEDEAAAAMRRIYEDAELRERLGEAARNDITAHHSRQAMSDWVSSRLHQRWREAESRSGAAPGRGKLARRLRRLLPT